MNRSGFKEVVAAALVWAALPWQSAVAQNSPPDAGQRRVPASAEITEGALQEVVVTAQKESQNLEKAAAAITVVTGDEIVASGVTNLASMQDLISGVRFQHEGVATEIYIRGVGTTLDFPLIDPPTAFNINGVYIPREMSSTTLFDMKGVEVLPGPQGTLYGRGALGGAINANLARPGDGTPDMMMFELGNYSLVHASAAADIPVTDTLKLRAAVSGLYHDGYMQSGADSAKDLGGRLSAMFTPTEQLSIYLWGQAETNRGNAANVTSRGSFTDPKSQATQNPGDAWDDRDQGSLASHLYAPWGPISAYPQKWRVNLFGGEVNWKLGEATLTYIPSFVDLSWRQGYWITAKPSVFGEDIGQQTHELRLSATEGPLKWLAGLYYYRLNNSGQLYLDFPPNGLAPGLPALWLDANDVQSNVLRGEAAFGQLTYSLTDAFRMVVGGRVSSDHRTAFGYVPTVVAGPEPPGVAPVVLSPSEPPTCLFGPCATYSGNRTWTHADYKAGVEYDLRPKSMLYATVQTAFQPGTFDNVPNRTIEPQKLLSFTAGSKNDLLGGKVRLNNEIYYYIYDDLVVQSFDLASGQQLLHNAQRTIIFGDQLDLSWLILPDTIFTTSVAYTHARYNQFSYVDGGVLQNFEGLQVQNSPDWSATLSLNHFWRLPSGAQIEANASTRVESGFWAIFSHNPGTYQAAYEKSDLSLTYHTPSDMWRLGLWVRNLENKAVVSAEALGGAADPGPGAYIPEPPRTFGMRMEWTLH